MLKAAGGKGRVPTSRPDRSCWYMSLAPSAGAFGEVVIKGHSAGKEHASTGSGEAGADVTSLRVGQTETAEHITKRAPSQSRSATFDSEQRQLLQVRYPLGERFSQHGEAVHFCGPRAE